MLFDEIDRRIIYLKSLRAKFIANLQSLVDLQNSFIKGILEEIYYYNEIRSKKGFSPSEYQDIVKIIQSEIKINESLTLDLTQISKNVNSRSFILYEISPYKERQYKSLKFLQDHCGDFKCAAISKHNNILITGSDDTTVRLWDIKNNQNIKCFFEHKLEVTCIASSSCSTLAVSGSNDKTLILWDIKNQRFKKVFKGHSGPVLSVTFGLDNNSVVSTGKKEVFVWDVNSLEKLRKIITINFVCSGVMTPNEFICAVDTNIEKWGLNDFKPKKSLKAHDSAIRSITKTDNNDFIITGSKDAMVKVWRMASMMNYANLSGHTEAVTCLYTNDNNYIL